MSFDEYENSAEASAPVELYEFSYQGSTYRYTSSDRDITIGPVTYTQFPIARTAIEDTGEIAKASITLTVRPDFAMANIFAVAPPSDVVNLIIKRVHMAETASATIIWAGRVLNVSWPSGACRMTCQTLYSSQKRPGLRRPYGRACPHVLYGNACGLNQAAFAEDVVVSGGATQTLQSAAFAAFADGYFRGGKVEIEISPGVTERRGIREHIGDTITLTYAFVGTEDITDATVYPGCDHTHATCVSKFANAINFGGQPYMVSKHPFGQNSVF
jgi:uncharacterized phage protein (TIGR02218 family)